MERENSLCHADAPLFAFHPADQLDTIMNNQQQEERKASILASNFLASQCGEFPSSSSFSSGSADIYRLNPPFRPFYENISLRRLFHFHCSVRLKYRPWFQPASSWNEGTRMSCIGNSFTMVEPATEAAIIDNQKKITRIKAIEREEREREREREQEREHSYTPSSSANENILYIAPPSMNFNPRTSPPPGYADSNLNWRRGNSHQDRDQSNLNWRN
jgi:hypothetical protein